MLAPPSALACSLIAPVTSIVWPTCPVRLTEALGMMFSVVADATAAEAVAYSYYPPLGHRSWGGAARRKAPNGQTNRRAYADWWNESMVLTLQLESVDAITNARQLLRPGVDALAFGPNDLEFSLEMHPEFHHLPL